MHEDVKRYADRNDIKGLRYIFVDCLDVDPTFEKYAEDFEYCKNKAGLFETHRELTPMTGNQQMWNDGYWVQLKTDLLKNFSRARFQHMMQVAQVVYAEKIVRITAEREEQGSKPEEALRQPVLENQKQSEKTEKQSTEHAQMSKREEQEKRLEEKRRQLAEENQRVLAEERRQKEQIEKRRADSRQTTASSMEGSDSKKVSGVVLVVVVILVIILLVVRM